MRSVSVEHDWGKYHSSNIFVVFWMNRADDTECRMKWRVRVKLKVLLGS